MHKESRAKRTISRYRGEEANIKQYLHILRTELIHRENKRPMLRTQI